MKILITGARSGIGLTTGLILAKEGHTVYLTTQTEKEKDKLKEDLKNIETKGDIEVLKLDITLKQDRRKILNLDLDSLINMAGVGYGRAMLEMEMSKIREVFEVNYFSTLKLIKTFIKKLNKEDREGNVVIVSSIAGLVPAPFIGSYASSKAALLTTATVLRQEMMLSKSKVRIKLIEPGLQHTGFNQLLTEDMKENHNYSPEFIKLEEKMINLFETYDLTKIAKKVAKAATSKSKRLKYRSPYYQVLGTKLYMLFFK